MVWHDFATREQAEAFTASETLRDAMRRAGVQGQPTVWLARGRPEPAAAAPAQAAPASTPCASGEASLWWWTIRHAPPSRR